MHPVNTSGPSRRLMLFPIFFHILQPIHNLSSKTLPVTSRSSLSTLIILSTSNIDRLITLTKYPVLSHLNPSEERFVL